MKLLLVSNSTVYGHNYQFLEENDTPVVGLREKAWLLVEDNSVTLKGTTGARIFRRDQPPVEALPSSDISELVRPKHAS
jgi:dipeptidase E